MSSLLSASDVRPSTKPSPPAWWLDVETMNYWSPFQDLNALTIGAAVETLQRAGKKVGIYSTGYQFRKIAGDYSPGFGGLQQTFKTKPGKSYTVSFSLAGNTDGSFPKKTMGVSAAKQKAEFNFDAAADLRRVATELLAEGDRRGVHQVGTPGLDHGLELGRLPAERVG